MELAAVRCSSILKWVPVGGHHKDGLLRIDPLQRTLELVCDKDGLVFLRGSSLTAQLRGKFTQACEGGNKMNRRALQVLVNKFDEFPWTSLLQGSPDGPETQTTPLSFSQHLDQVCEKCLIAHITVKHRYLRLWEEHGGQG